MIFQSLTQSKYWVGITIDSKLSFTEHKDNLCTVINKKIFLLTRNKFLFSHDFKIIVFKLFVLPVVDYCSTLYSMSCLSKVERCFNKAVRLILGIKFSRCEISDVDYQVKIFKPFGIQPLKLRLFSHYCLFLSNIIKFKRAVSLIGFLNSIRASSAYNLRTKFITPNLRTELKRLSFISISSKLLNLFLYNNIIIKNFDTTFLTLNLLKLYNEFTSIINRVTIDYWLTKNFCLFYLTF